MYIDSHCHLLSTEYDDVDSEIKKATKSGVFKMIVNGYDVKSSKEAALLSKKYNEIYASVGIGPENIDDLNENYKEEIENIVKTEKIVSIGEIGLDYYWTKENKEKQIEVFRNMLDIAKKYNLPVIVHCRDAFLDTYNILKEYGVKGILHCYSGSIEMAKEFIKIGFLIGVGGIVTFKNAKTIKEVVKNISISSISLETDSPYLSPEPNRGKKNNPSNLVYIARKIAELKEISIDDVINHTNSNIEALFDL